MAVVLGGDLTHVSHTTEDNLMRTSRPFTHAMLAALAVAGTAAAQEPNTPPRPAQDKPTPPDAKRADDGKANAQQQQAISSLQRANEQFRSTVTKTLQDATRSSGEQVQQEQVTIASIGNGTVVAGAPTNGDSHRDATDPNRKNRNDDPSRNDPSRNDPSRNDTGTDTPQRDANNPQSGRTSADNYVNRDQQDGECLGVIVVCEKNGSTTTAPRAGDANRVPRGDTTDPRNDAGGTPQDGARANDRSATTVSVTGDIASGVYKVRSSGNQVKLYSCADDRLAASIPLVEIDKVNPADIRSGADRTSGAGATGADRRSDVPSTDGLDRGDRPVQPRMGLQPEWQTVFASVVCALEGKSS